MNINALSRRKKLVIAMGLTLTGSTIVSCTSDDLPDDTPTTVNTINANGGTSLYDNGGDGGALSIRSYGDAGIEIKKEGKASTGFNRPALPSTADLGSNPLLITENTNIDDAAPYYTAVIDGTGQLSVGQVYLGTDSVLRTSVAGGLAVYATDTLVTDNQLYRSSYLSNELLQAVGDDAIADPAPAGMLYVNTNSPSYIYLSDGDTASSDTAYTGLSVATDTTLTLGENSGCNAQVRFQNDIDNQGTITRNADNCNLALNSYNYFGSGNVNNAGSAEGESGGSININADFGINNSGTIDSSGYDNAENDGGSAGSIRLNASLYIINSGTLDASGGDGFGDGGDGDYITISQPTYLENSGMLISNGGSNISEAEASGQGGSAGNISLRADIVLNNTKTATISANGGDGDEGGYSDGISLNQYSETGALLNAGNLSANGGNSLSDDDGANGGEIYFYTDDAQIQSSGELSSTGGNSIDYEGGNGGDISFYIDADDDNTGKIIVSGNIDISGGDSEDDYGGDGGEISFTNYADEGVTLLGYSSLEINGGNGEEGGDGGDNDGVDLYSDGPIVNEVAINAKGGNSTDEDDSGKGGDVKFYSDTSIANSGAINTDSGEGYYSDNGGSIYMYTYESDITNNASLSANSSTATSYGDDGGYIELTAESGTVNNSARLSANGSNADYYGGDGGQIQLYGVNLSNTSTISAKGGNATVTEAVEGEEEAEGYGGNGGFISMNTELLVSPTSTGSLSYAGGTGVTENGIEGCAKINFITQGNCSDIELGGEGEEEHISFPSRKF